ncbi:MAG: hypothetical protein IPH98_16605 [Saprospiraceae bacterium]|nr:hypothetical protein [Candidatus Defluviibacterium haderslevense]
MEDRDTVDIPARTQRLQTEGGFIGTSNFKVDYPMIRTVYDQKTDSTLNVTGKGNRHHITS